jgi:hypothetical protein
MTEMEKITEEAIAAHIEMTEEDIAAHIERLAEIMQSQELAALVRRLHDHVPRKKWRYAIGLVIPEGCDALSFNPDTYFQPTHIVLPDEVAKSYELNRFIICNVSMCITETPLPLETFSINAMVDDRLAAINEWTNAPIMTPANRCAIGVVKRRDDAPPFRGLLWGWASMG